MGVLDNLKGLKRSAQIKQKETMIGRDAVVKGTVESVFLNNYETFKVGLISWIENILLEKGNQTLVVRPKKGTDASKFLRYTLEDQSIINNYNVTQRKGGEFVFSLKGNIEELIVEEGYGQKQEQDSGDGNTLYV